ncbi:Na(+) H(+) antiporter subunit B [hydrothermal vent metagenome]|uniref:Na(+) H(+) antiporter subunit B n=1 Tax=hydrothermal vent metagenome TaxID=652676 RepID=A0A3B0S939_9ZZZZ
MEFPFDIFLVIDLITMSMMLVVCIVMVRLNNLFAIVMLFGVYSLLAAVWFVSLDAVDVAFTEAAVGAGISTVLMLGAMLLTSREAKPTPSLRKWTSLLIVLATGAALMYATLDMPHFGDANSAANSYVGLQYMINTITEVDVPNVVTAVLASYRGYDTFGETVVVLTAGLGVMMILGIGTERNKTGQVISSEKPSKSKPPAKAVQAAENHHIVLQVIAKMLIPIIVLYALYVQFHGDFGPGGGFQAGVIFASAVILYSLIFGMEETRRAIPPRLVQIGTALGVLIYGGTGLVTLAMGGKFLDYNALNSHDPIHGQHLGILWVEIGVLVTVASVMLAIYYGFAGRYRELKDQDW